MVSCLLGFIFSGNANLSQVYTMRDDLAIDSSLAIVVKKGQNNTVNMSERTSFGAVKTFSAPNTIG